MCMTPRRARGFTALAVPPFALQSPSGYHRPYGELAAREGGFGESLSFLALRKPHEVDTEVVEWLREAWSIAAD